MSLLRDEVENKKQNEIKLVLDLSINKIVNDSDQLIAVTVN